MDNITIMQTTGRAIKCTSTAQVLLFETDGATSMSAGVHHDYFLHIATLCVCACNQPDKVALTEPIMDNILRKHFKLWIDSTNILADIFSNDIFVDSESLIAGINDEVNLFVRTRAFDRAVECLEKKNVLIIIGNPGVGKTVTSKMLVLYYASKGYRVRYTTDGAYLSSLKKSLSQSADTKEIILDRLTASEDILFLRP